MNYRALILQECELLFENYFKVFSKSCIVHDFFEVKGQFYQNSHTEHMLLPGSTISRLFFIKVCLKFNFLLNEVFRDLLLIKILQFIFKLFSGKKWLTFLCVQSQAIMTRAGSTGIH